MAQKREDAIDTNLGAGSMRRDTLTDETTTARTREEELRVPVVEEELAVGKRTVETGGVRVHKNVTETPIVEDVQLHEEHVTVERRPVDREVRPEDMRAFENTTVEMRETAEEAVVEKRARVVEEVVVGKEMRERTEHITDTVRRTDVDIQPIATGMHASGTASDTTTSGMTSGTTARNFDSIDASCRTHFHSNFADAGWDYDTGYQHAYRYGYDLAGSGKDWSAVEPEVQSNWETRNKGTWERFKDAIRYGFDQGRY